MAEILLESINPNGNIQATVELDDSTCYFYLFGSKDSGLGMRALWVRNLVAAPMSLDVNAMKSGKPPLNPVSNCRFPSSQPSPIAESLKIVWLPEGNGAALYENDEVLAIIPPWSGFDGFHGYARDCIGQSTLAWELGPDNVLIERFVQAQGYWNDWSDQDLWSSIRESQISDFEAALGSHSNYYAIDGGNWPPKAILRIPRDQGTVLITTGVSVRPQPMVEMSSDTPELLRRIELAVLLPSTWSDSAVERFGSYLSGQSQLPWTRFEWLGTKHTIPCDSWVNQKYQFAMLLDSHPVCPRIPPMKQLGDPVNVLWFVPISEDERHLAEVRGSDELIRSMPIDRWSNA